MKRSEPHIELERGPLDDVRDAWKYIRQGFNKAWKDLADAFDQAGRERT